MYSLIFNCKALKDLNLRKKKLLEYIYIFAILNISQHWILIVVEFKKETFNNMDPFKAEFLSKKY